MNTVEETDDAVARLAGYIGRNNTLESTSLKCHTCGYIAENPRRISVRHMSDHIVCEDCYGALKFLIRGPVKEDGEIVMEARKA